MPPATNRPSDDRRSSVLSKDRLKGSASSRVVISSTAWETESLSSSHCPTTDVVTIAINPATNASPTNSAIAAAGRSSRRLRSRSAIGVRAGATVSATMIGRTITWRYQSSAITAKSAAPTARSRHDQSAAFARFGGTGGTFTGRSCRRSDSLTGRGDRQRRSPAEFERPTPCARQRPNVISPGTRPCARRGAPRVQASAFA